MSNELKCPFCNKPLQPTLRQSDEYWCENYDCPGTNIEWVGSQKLWQELDRWKQSAEDHQNWLRLAEKRLERTRKALGVAVDAIDEILYLDSGKFCKEPAEMWKIAKSAKDKITTLEQKDVK